jgi:hypothetical protein
MLDHIYAMYDKKIGTYLPPFTAANNEVAIRVVGAVVRENQLMVHHPEDFECFKIGVFDTTNGSIDPHEPKHVLSIQDLFKNLEEDFS